MFPERLTFSIMAKIELWSPVQTKLISLNWPSKPHIGKVGCPDLIHLAITRPKVALECG